MPLSGGKTQAVRGRCAGFVELSCGWRRCAVVCVLAVTLAVLCAAASPQMALSGRAASDPRVLLIGDSVATGMQWHDDAIAILQRGLAVDWEVAVCRRLTGVSCTFQGVTPPNLVDLVSSLGTVPPIVVVEMGYNDFAATFAASVELSIQTLLQHGAKHILWLTLREVQHPYIPMNGVLAAAAALHPQLRLVDWNRYARSHPDWFQDDGEHLVDAGGVAMARLVHLAVDAITRPLKIVPGRLAVGQVGHTYSAQLAATGGVRPYRWQLVGRPPLGLHLLTGGRLFGLPRKLQRVRVTLRVSDAEGQTAAQRVVLEVAAR
jgi:hypothetical protein